MPGGFFFQSFCRLLNVQINHAILYGRPLKFFKKNLCSIVIIFWQPVLISPKTKIFLEDFRIITSIADRITANGHF